MRNRVFRHILTVSLLSITVFTTCAIVWPQFAVWWVLSCGGTVLILALCYTGARMRELAKLSDYLRSVASGSEVLDVRDNEEGELSILKNEIYKMTVMLWEQSKTLQKDKIALSSSISDISHQLKTPLTSMLVMTDLLCDGNLPPEKRAEFTRSMQQQLERMQWLLSALLKLSRLDAGTVELHREETVIGEVLESALRPLKIPMELKNITYSCHGESDMIVLVDKNWLREVFVNLLKNAVEHTPENGSITILCANSPIFAEIAVQDTGCGICREDLPLVFTRFHRGKNASPDSVGIGLSMAKQIVELHGGSITVNSTQGCGARFTVRLFRRIV